MHVTGDKLMVAGRFGIGYAPITAPGKIGNFRLIPNINYTYYNRISDFVVSRHSIFLNTDKGFYKYNIDSLITDKRLFNLSDKNVFSLVMTYPFERKVAKADTITLDPSYEKLTLGVINFYGKGNPTFKYHIDGHQNIIQQTDGDIFVGNLSSGEYHRIVCRASDDVWNDNTLSFYVYRSPYWWQTTKWKVIIGTLGLIFIIVLLLVVVFITRKIVARANEKKRNLTELQLKAIYAQINPHFIFNTLNAAQYFINKKRFDDAYSHVSKFSRLLRAYLKSSQDRYITLEDEIQMLKNYIELQQTRFEEKFEYVINIDNKIPVKNLQIPSLLLQPLVENAINHGLFHKGKGGMLILSFLQGASSSELICIIDDNGVGRHKASEIKKEDSIKRESYGTRLTQQLIDIYREYEKMDIYLEYTDKTPPETGTIVKLTIKNVKYVA
jgi:two-component sensor histidine kinase